MFAQKRQTIMLVDDNQATLNMGKKLLQDHYEVYPLPSAERLFTFLKAVEPDLILLDVSMPSMGGFDIIKILKADVRHADIPVIFLTSKTEEMDEWQGLALGAADYITKPFSGPILLKRIENHMLLKKQTAELKNFNENLIEMVKKKASQITGLQDSIIDTFAEIIEFRDSFTGGHIHRTQEYMRLLLNHLVENDSIYSDEVFAWETMESIVTSTQLHDLGKISISDAILNKPGKLTPEEFEVMKTHAAKGVEIIGKMKKDGETQTFLHYAEIIAGTHHEKWNGTGYPNGLKGQDIPLLGRMMAIADVYDALISVRPYKEPFSTEQAAKIILKDSGTHFDPVLVDVFMEMEGAFAAIAKVQESVAVTRQ